LIFSCETAADEEGDFILRASRRYAHSHAYAERLCRAAGFAAVDFTGIDLRMEVGAYIRGFIVVAEKQGLGLRAKKSIAAWKLLIFP
jgi:predicted TPR repeat methyltransferase